MRALVADDDKYVGGFAKRKEFTDRMIGVNANCLVVGTQALGNTLLIKVICRCIKAGYRVAAAQCHIMLLYRCITPKISILPVGIGLGKGGEVADAIRKGGEVAKQAMVAVSIKDTTIPHEVYVEWDGAKILLKPASAGTGVIAGSKVRSVLELGGVKDVVAKNLGSSNPLNQVKAIFKALHQLKNREKNLAARKGA